jgi:ACS family sodium-dependent inorganic phosphate cotransporter
MNLAKVKCLFPTASGGQAFALVATVYVGCNRDAALALLLISMAFIGFFYPSLKLNCIDLSPNYAGTLGSLSTCVGTLSGVIAPYLIGILTPTVSFGYFMLIWYAGIDFDYM